MKTCIISCILSLLLAIFAMAGEKPLIHEGYAIFFKANQAYKDGAYEKAATAYEQLIRRGAVSGSIMYNLGNSYFRMNSPGKAILNYERAKRLMPRDPDLDFNLRYTRDRIEDRIEGTSSFSIFEWLHTFTMSEIFWSFALINFLFWVALLLRLWIRSEWSLYTVIGLGLLWIVLGVSSGMKWHQDTHDMRGVVTAPEITIHAGPDKRDTTLFKLHAGAIVICERDEGDWRLIQLTPEKRGWTRSEWVERIIITRIPSRPVTRVTSSNKKPIEPGFPGAK